MFEELFVQRINSPRRLFSLAWIGSLLLLVLACPPASGQPATSKLPLNEQTANEQAAAPSGLPGVERLSGEALTKFLAEQFALLDDPNYRARARARWSLEQYPSETIERIPQVLSKASINTNQQLIDLLDHFATRPDVTVSAAAVDTLQELSHLEGTALGTMAKRCKAAIDDAKELQATEVLQSLGAAIGHLPLVINGAKNSLTSSPDFALEIKAGEFVGSEESFKWIRYLRSVKVVALQGPVVSEALLKAITEMPDATKILFKRCNVTAKDLLILRTMSKIEHLELSYVPVGDEIVGALCELPLSESLRLFGTKVTSEGEKRIAQQLDGLEIYRGSGGFLGIQSQQVGAVIVTRVEPNSAAYIAGIMELDHITKINDVEVKNFPQLREELAKYAESETISVVVIRQGFDPQTGRPVAYEKTINVVLGALE